MIKKKVLSLLSACLLAGALFTGCGGDDTPKPAENPQPADIKIGMIAGLNASEQQLTEIMKKIEADAGLQLMSHNFVYYDSLNAMQMGLESKAVDEMSTYAVVSKYLMARKPDLTIVNDHKQQMPMVDNFCCAVKSDRTDLLNELNTALEAMQQDGTLETLTKQYITELKDDEEPAAVEMPMFEDADTFKVAVTGDIPPLDLIKVDGTPAGFNTAVLAEISNRINKNFELVSIESAARASALSSGTVDVVFWVRVPNNDDMFPDNYDRPNGIDATVPYFKDEIVHVGRK
ncbi:MAG: transporter substrate-binding domain-containing protein [Selenomonadaceae bacterium]|nr:transporter substrate-binding domain-containing protein [Selenomonadaceae bacterium]